MILLEEHISMISKKLFYTGYTRAKTKITILSTLEIIDYCIHNNKDSKRNCNILNLLNDL